MTKSKKSTYFNIIFFLLPILALILSSCSNTSNEDALFELNINELQLGVVDISTTSALLNISFNDPSELRVFQQKILFRRLGAQEWLETDSRTLVDLVPARRYEAKAVVSLKGVNEESEPIEFLTKGFEHGNLEGRQLDLYNREYEIYSNGQIWMEENSPEVSGYIKVENDSLPLKSIEMENGNSSIFITLPDNVQSFFENDTEHYANKPFSVSLVSGEYVVETSSYRSYGEESFFEGLSNFSVFNEIPNVEEFQGSLDLGDMVVYSFGGTFRDINDRFNFLGEDDFNHLSGFSLIITNSNNETVRTFTEADVLNEREDSGTLEGILLFQSGFSLGYRLKSFLNPVNTVEVQITDDSLPSGVYEMQYILSDQNNVEHRSNRFAFAIE